MEFHRAKWAQLLSTIRSDDPVALRALILGFVRSGVELLDSCDPEDAERRTPAMLAMWMGCRQAADTLARMGADFSAVDARGRSVSWYAQQFGQGLRLEALTEFQEATYRARVMDDAAGAVEPPAGTGIELPADAAPVRRRRLSEL